MNFFSWVKRIFQRRPHEMHSRMSDNGNLTRMLEMVDRTQEHEYSCDEAYEFLDQFAEVVARGEDASQLMPLVDQHLKMCPDCREEYEALLRMMQE